jgi:hypothetical protein
LGVLLSREMVAGKERVAMFSAHAMFSVQKSWLST